MLIPYETIRSLLDLHKIHINGVLHVGAHDCEELSFYDTLSIPHEDIIWLEAMDNKVSAANSRGIPNVYKCVVSEKDNMEVIFNISNNGQSSSILELGTHAYRHPEVTFVEKIAEKTTTIDTFFSTQKLDETKYNFWNLDIQGAELLALKGGINSLRHVDAVYLEINEEHLYKDCALLPEIDAFLSDNGFKRVSMVTTQWKWGDALYLRI